MPIYSIPNQNGAETPSQDKKTVFEEEIEPQQPKESRGIKRGAINGDENQGDIKNPRSGATNEFENKFSQRKRRKKQAKKDAEAETRRTNVGGRQLKADESKQEKNGKVRPDSENHANLDRRGDARLNSKNIERNPKHRYREGARTTDAHP